MPAIISVRRDFPGYRRGGRLRVRFPRRGQNQSHMKVYISGPITGFNRTAVEQMFAAAEEKIRQRGDIPINPLRNGLTEEATWREHMNADLRMLIECDAIYMVGQWWESRGAMIEWNLANGLDLRMYNLMP